MVINRYQVYSGGLKLMSAVPRISEGGIKSLLQSGLGTVLIFFIFFALTPPCTADPLTILEGLDVVTSKGYDVRIAKAYHESAVLAEDQARSQMKPHVNAYADYTWLENRPEALFAGGSSPLSEDHFLRYGVTVRQTLTDFGRTSAQIDSARAGAAAKSRLVDQARNGLALEFVHAYISLLRAERTLEVARQEVKRFEAHLADARNLYDSGEVTRSDVLAADVALSDAIQRTITARDGRELAASRVNYLTLRPLDHPVQAAGFPYLFCDRPDLSELLVEAESSRPEIRILDEQIAALEANLRSQKKDGLPMVFVSGGYSYEENPYRVYEDNWSAVLGLSWDLYTGGARTAGKSRTISELSASLAERSRIQEKVHLEIREALLAHNGASERISVAEKAANQAEENLRLQNARYQEGEASATEVTDAVTTLTKAQNNLCGAVFDRQRAEAQVLYAAGLELYDAYETATSSGQGLDSGRDNRENHNE